MPCDTQMKPKQTVQERIAEIKEKISKLDAMLKKRQVKVVIGPQGAVAFAGWQTEDRAGITDACAYRRVMATGSALARSEVERAERLAGRRVDTKVVAAGIHSHDSGVNWHGKG